MVYLLWSSNTPDLFNYFDCVVDCVSHFCIVIAIVGPVTSECAKAMVETLSFGEVVFDCCRLASRDVGCRSPVPLRRAA